MTEKLKIALPIIVEGRYDKATISGYVDANIITTDGFSVFNNKEKQRLIRRLCERGVILLTDSDGGGRQIRSFISGILPKDKIYHLYIPEIEGKERRKAHASAAGLLGVEGMKKEVILGLLEPFANGEVQQKNEKMITKVDFFEDKLTGAPNSAARRAEICKALDLPHDMTPNALLAALNMLLGYEKYKELINRIFEGEE
jgi:ribonuclease M5